MSRQMQNNAKGGDNSVKININDKQKEGLYVGSATNVMRLFIALSLFICIGAYLFGVKVGNLESRIANLEQRK